MDLNPLHWFGSESDDERPPKPDTERVVNEFEYPVYEVTIEYRNSDTETFESIGGIYSRSDTGITFNIEPTFYRRTRSGVGKLSRRWERHTVNYEVLAREPIMKQIDTKTYVTRHTKDYDWGSRHTWDNSEWRESVKADSIQTYEL